MRVLLLSLFFSYIFGKVEKCRADDIDKHAECRVQVVACGVAGQPTGNEDFGENQVQAAPRHIQGDKSALLAVMPADLDDIYRRQNQAMHGEWQDGACGEEMVAGQISRQ